MTVVTEGMREHSEMLGRAVSRGVSRIFFLGGPDRVTICRGVAYCIDI